MRRRDALRWVGAGPVGLTGCLGDGSGDDGSAPGTDTPTDSQRTPVELGASVETERYGRVSVDSVTVQKSLLHGSDRPWREVSDPEGDQIIVVSGVLGDAAPRVTMDGEPVDHAPRVDVDGAVGAVAVPVRSADSAAVVVDGDDAPAWRLPASIREDLAAAASFRVHGAGMTTLGATDAPLVTTDRTSEADLGESSPVFELTVENAGDEDGTFRGVTALSNDRDGPVRFPVAAGETVTRAVTNSLVESWGSGMTLRESPSPRTREFRFDDG